MESVHGEAMLKNGVGGNEMEFFLLNGIKLVKMHSDGKVISVYTFGYQYILITKSSASFENSTSAHEVF